MVRMQIQFTEVEAEALRSDAARRQVSISALVREAVDARLSQPQKGPTLEERRTRAKAACGLYHSGRSDISARHDDYIAEALDE